MIEQIIENENVDIYFQPIVSIRTKIVYAFESLTRCSFNGQNLPPDILFNLAKEKNLNMQLDEMTRNKAIKKFYKYYLDNKDLILFLNFESDLINNFDVNEAGNSFIETIMTLNIPFKNFVLEIKEDEISNTHALEKFCQRYKSLGFSIALDDFGTGSSNFHRINLIRPDIIKIDRSLFTDVKNNQINKEVVKAISKMSHNLGIRVLAEGVEDEDAICLGMKLLINLYQGYYFCKPANEIKKSENEKVAQKILDIGKLFKKRTLDGINKKRTVINQYDLISNSMIEKFEKEEQVHKMLEEEFLKYEDIEAIYLIDTKSSKQINNTIMNKGIKELFKPSNHGDEHFLKEYYYITLESKQGIFLSQKYISYASGNICKTFAKKFSVEEESYILCFDIVLGGL